MNEPNQWNWSGEGWVDGGGRGSGEGRDSCDAPTDTCAHGRRVSDPAEPARLLRASSGVGWGADGAVGVVLEVVV